MDLSKKQSIYFNLTSKFLEIATHTDLLDYIEDYHRDKFNTILNELNILDYKILQVADSKVNS